MSFLADKLVKAFPCESVIVYFCEPTFNSAGIQTKRGSGKLVEKMYNICASLKKVGSSPKDKKRKLRMSAESKKSEMSTPDTLLIGNIHKQIYRKCLKRKICITI